MEFFLSTTNILISIWVALAIAMLFIIARTDLSLGRKMLIVPLTFLVLYATITDTIGLLGFPYDGLPEKEFQIVHHAVREDENKHRFILLWARDEDGDRMYRIPWTEETQKNLKKSEKRWEKGVPQMGKFVKKKPGDKKNGINGMTDGGELEIYDFPHQTRIPKNTQ